MLVVGPAFSAATPKQFLGNLKMLAKTTDRAEGAKKAISALFRVAESALEMVGGESATLKTLGGIAPVHPLGQTYFSQTPFRYGDHIAKFQLVPVSGIKDLEKSTIDADGRPDAIRDEMNETLIEDGGTWELRVQLNTDLEKMPIEDASVAWEKGVSEHAEDALSFSPWHGIAAHRPLGGVNRVRKATYKASADYRGRFNGCPIHEPG